MGGAEVVGYGGRGWGGFYLAVEEIVLVDEGGQGGVGREVEVGVCFWEFELSSEEERSDDVSLEC